MFAKDRARSDVGEEASTVLRETAGDEENARQERGLREILVLAGMDASEDFPLSHGYMGPDGFVSRPVTTLLGRVLTTRRSRCRSCLLLRRRLPRLVRLPFPPRAWALRLRPRLLCRISRHLRHRTSLRLPALAMLSPSRERYLLRTSGDDEGGMYADLLGGACGMAQNKRLAKTDFPVVDGEDGERSRLYICKRPRHTPMQRGVSILNSFRDRDSSPHADCKPYLSITYIGYRARMSGTGHATTQSSIPLHR